MRWLREHPFAADALLGAVLFAVMVPGLWFRDHNVDVEFRDPDALGVLLVALTSLPLACRRRRR